MDGFPQFSPTLVSTSTRDLHKDVLFLLLWRASNLPLLYLPPVDPEDIIFTQLHQLFGYNGGRICVYSFPSRNKHNKRKPDIYFEWVFFFFPVLSSSSNQTEKSKAYTDNRNTTDSHWEWWVNELYIGYKLICLVAAVRSSILRGVNCQAASRRPINIQYQW